MKKENFPDLIKEENDQNLIKLIAKKFRVIIYSADIEAVASSYTMEIFNHLSMK